MRKFEPEASSTSLRQNSCESLWRPQGWDWWGLLAVGSLPLLLAIPRIVGLLHDNPILYVGAVAEHFRGGFLPGPPAIDPNSGFTTQALGRLAASDWLRGTVPWWNPYSGVGLPLAAEYQSGAFFPLVLLLKLDGGILWLQLVLQIIAGWGCNALLRQIGLTKYAALVGGMLFSLNGTFAWLLLGPAQPVPFLPWMLLGIERAWAKAQLELPGGWRLMSVALALMLLAGFPETAYISGLFALAWALLRWVQCDSGHHRLAMTWRLAVGGLVGVALAAPQILAFFEALPLSILGGHGGAFAHAALPRPALISSLLAPYAFGPIFAFVRDWHRLNAIWGNVGGYVDVLLIVLSAYGFWSRRSALSMLLVVWIALALAKTFGLQPFLDWWNLVPGVSESAFYRYAPPTWELAFVILASFGINALVVDNSWRRGRFLFAALVFAACAGAGVAYGIGLWPHIRPSGNLRGWALASAAWAMSMGGIALLLLAWPRMRWRAVAVGSLLVANAAVLFAIPTLSSPRHGEIDTPAIAFLQDNLGLQRFFTMGPIRPNYGAYFGIASINHTYLPVSRRWVDWVRTHLDSAAHPINFMADVRRDANAPSAALELRRNIHAYEWVGVKYVVARKGDNPFLAHHSTAVRSSGQRPLPLLPGQEARGRIPAQTISEELLVDRIGIVQGNYRGTATGSIKVTLCSAGQCASGKADLAKSDDNAAFWIPLDRPLRLKAGMAANYRITHEGGTTPEALWTYPLDRPGLSQELHGPAGPVRGMGLKISLGESKPDPTPPQVYSDNLMTIYELPDPKPYFETIGRGCSVNVKSRTNAIVDCEKPSRLVRREMVFPGWKASINGRAAVISEHEGLFQQLDLAAGRNEVEFDYAPPHVIWAWVATWISLGMLLVSLLAGVVIPKRKAR